MANPKFLGVDLSGDTFSWSETVNSSYPLSNLKNYYPDIRSRSNGVTAGQTFVVDKGSAVACNMLVIHGHNIAAIVADTMSLEADDNSGFTTPETIIAAITISTADEIVLQTFATKTYRYWRIVFACAGPLLVAPEFGNFFLGTSLDFTLPQQYNFYTNAPSSMTSKSRAMDGRMRTVQSYGAIRRHKASFKLLNDAFILLYKTFLATVNNDGIPFYYIDKDSNVYLVNLEKGFNPYDAFRYNLNDITDLLMESTMADS